MPNALFAPPSVVTKDETKEVNNSISRSFVVYRSNFDQLM